MRDETRTPVEPFNPQEFDTGCRDKKRLAKRNRERARIRAEAKRRAKPEIITELVQCCSETGQVGCMDCIEGQCSGSDAECYTEVHTCTGCGGHDAWGEMHHDPTCPHYIEPEIPL